MIRKLFPELLLCLLAVATSVPALQSGDLIYTINPSDTNTVTIIDYTGSGGAIVIPSTIAGKLVTAIGEASFMDCTNLTSIVMPESITTIEWAAFARAGLTSITLGKNINSIGEHAFNGCSGMISITVDMNNAIYSSFDGVLFNKGKTTLIQYPPGKVGNYEVPDGVTSIGVGAFAFCRKLTSITIPDDVTIIEWDAFAHCTSLTSITIPNGVTSIGTGAFAYSTNLVNVVFSGAVNTIGEVAFLSCENLAGIYFQNNAPQAGSNVFIGSEQSTVYYRTGTMGWGSTYGGRPAVLWDPLIQTDCESFGVSSNGFGFNIAESASGLVVVRVCTNLIGDTWAPILTNSMNGGSAYFHEPDWENYPARFYRLSMP